MANPLPVVSGLNAQRAATPAPAGPEFKEEELAAPEQRAQRSHRGAGPETPTRKPPDLEEIEDSKKADKLVQSAHKAGADIPGVNGGVASDAVEASIQRMRSRPAPGLDPETRSKMEEGIGFKFGGTRVHTDASADKAANDIGAGRLLSGRTCSLPRDNSIPKPQPGNV